MGEKQGFLGCPSYKNGPEASIVISEGQVCVPEVRRALSFGQGDFLTLQVGPGYLKVREKLRQPGDVNFFYNNLGINLCYGRIKFIFVQDVEL